MNRKLKALGLALFAVFAFGSLIASTASGQVFHKFHSDGTPTTLTVDRIGATLQVFGTTVDELTCETVGGSGTITGTEATQATFSPTYSGCKAVNKKLNTDVIMNGCDYLFTSETPKGKEHAEVHIVCPTGKEIEIKTTIGGVQFNCVDVPGQTPTGGGVTYHNAKTPAGTEDVTLTATVTGITYTETGACGSGEANNGFYNAEITVTGENSKGEPTNISVS